MGLFQSFDVCATGMTAQRFRMDTIAQNIANVNTTRTENGTPYRRKIVTFQEKELNPVTFKDTLQYARSFKGNGVRVSSVSSDMSTDFIKAYDPSHPDADEDGYVYYPNVNTVTEMTRTENGTPYRRKIVTFQEKELNPVTFKDTLQYARSFKGNGVRVSSVSSDMSTDFIKAYDPSHPDADEDGYVYYPNVNTVTEMTNLIDSSRAYEANVTAFNAVKAMTQSGISIGSSV